MEVVINDIAFDGVVFPVFDAWRVQIPEIDFNQFVLNAGNFNNPLIPAPPTTNPTESPFAGIWSGTYSYSSVGDGGCTYNSNGTMTLTISVNGSAASGATSMTGFQLRYIPSCDYFGDASSSGTFTATISGNNISGSSSYPIAESGGTWTPSFSGTLSGNTISGTLSGGGSGTFTWTKQ